MSHETRRALIDQAIAFLGTPDEAQVAKVRARVGDLLEGVTDEALVTLLHRAATTGETWGYHAPDDLARQVNHVMSELVFAEGSDIEGLELLDGVDGPVTFVPNHLSFADANLFECLLHRAGREAIGQRLCVLAGPKVYSDFFRRFSSLCFGTIKTPQSQSRATGEAVMPKREVARIAQLVIHAVEERRAAGDHPLVFVEGTRSRDAHMQRTVAAASRYFDNADTVIVPVGITGSQMLVPVGEEHGHVARVGARIGRAVRAGEITARCEANRRLFMDAIGLLIAKELPPEYRGAYGDEASNLDAARRAVEALGGGA